MSCGFLYEIRRKSEEFDQHFDQTKRESSNLSTCSKDEDIWEVPEETFENVYHQMYFNDDMGEEKQIESESNAISEVFNSKQFNNTETLHISLSTEKIALKSLNQQSENLNKTSCETFETVNKFVNMDTNIRTSINRDVNTSITDMPNVSRSKVQWKNVKSFNNTNNPSSASLLNFAIAPKNVSSKVQKQTQEEEEEQKVAKLPDIKLTSFSARNPYAKSISNVPRRKSLPGAEINKHIAESSTSPESLLDNILSAASSVSVQSSSVSSNGIITDSDVNKLRQDRKGRESPSSNFTKHNMGILKTQIPELKIITASNSLTDQQAFNIGSHPSPSLFATSNASHSDSSETASNQTRSTSASPLRSLSPNVATEVSVYPDELLCKICKELFKDPRSLNCLHSFCFQCIVNENFKQDASIPFWSQPQSIQASEVSSQLKDLDEQHIKVLDSPIKSARSASSDIETARSSSDFSNSSLRNKQKSAFNFKRRKSSDRLPPKSKTDSTSATLSQQSCQDSPRLQIDLTRIITCKVCRFATEVPVGGIRQLPQNFLLVRKIEKLRFTIGEEIINRIWCSLCYEETNATYHCLTCTLNLCTLCKESHERQKSTSQHNIRNIIDLRRARRDQASHIIDNSTFVLKCSLHPGFDIKSFCNVCLQVSCSDCLILLHKGHKHETLSKSIHSFGRILRDTVEQTKPLCNYAEHSVAKLNEISKNINRKCDEVQAEVEEFMLRYFEAIEAHKNTLLQQVHRARESKVEMILEQQINLEKRNQEALMAVKFSQELTDVASDVEILSYMKILLKRFEYCRQFKPPVDPKISDTLHFLPKIIAPEAKNQNGIPVFGIITMQTVEPSLCTLQWDGISQLRLHKKAELVLMTRDADGASLCHGGLHIKCQIKYKDNHTKLLPIQISDNRDGSYIISFTPDSQGTIILTININDKPVKGSPFCIQASNLRPHSGIYHCCAFCSSKGDKSIKCACNGRMPRFNGCGHGHVGHPGRRHWSCCGNVLENSECSVANRLLKL